MALSDLLAEKLARLDSVPLAMSNATIRADKVIFEELIILLEDLQRDAAGAILTNNANLAAIQGIVERLQTFIFQTEYQTALVEFAGEFVAQGVINDAYFKTLTGSFAQKSIYTNVLKASQRNAITLLDEGAISKVFSEPLRDILNNSVVTGQSFRDAVKSMRTFVEGGLTTGGEIIEGTLARHVKQVTSDGFSHADRTYTEIINEDLGLVWFRYTGGLISDSRVFCVERNGKYFHKEEVREWGVRPKQWQGRDKITDKSTIFTVLGGYNCKHSVMPVLQSVVPREVVARNKSKGNV